MKYSRSQSLDVIKECINRKPRMTLFSMVPSIGPGMITKLLSVRTPVGMTADSEFDRIWIWAVVTKLGHFSSIHHIIVHMYVHT